MSNEDGTRIIYRRTPESAAMLANVKRAMAITATLNRLTFNDADEIRTLFSQLIGKKVDESFLLIPPFYTAGGEVVHQLTQVAEGFTGSCDEPTARAGIDWNAPALPMAGPDAEILIWPTSREALTSLSRPRNPPSASAGNAATLSRMPASRMTFMPMSMSRRIASI